MYFLIFLLKWYFIEFRDTKIQLVDFLQQYRSNTSIKIVGRHCYQNSTILQKHQQKADNLSETSTVDSSAFFRRWSVPILLPGQMSKDDRNRRNVSSHIHFTRDARKGGIGEPPSKFPDKKASGFRDAKSLNEKMKLKWNLLEDKFKKRVLPEIRTTRPAPGNIVVRRNASPKPNALKRPFRIRLGKKGIQAEGGKKRGKLKEDGNKKRPQNNGSDPCFGGKSMKVK